VILVVGVKLGCINHAMLTARRYARGLPLAGWIANDVQPPGKRHAEYLATLKNRLAAPFLGEIPWLADIAQRDDLGQYLDLSALDPASSTAPAAVHPAP
jgi:dethiobiotin synthetase